MSGFRFNEKAIKKVANDAVADIDKAGQKSLDAVHRRHAGKPVSEVKAALRRELSRTPLNPDREQLHDWATLISEGTRVVLKPEHI